MRGTDRLRFQRQFALDLREALSYYVSVEVANRFRIALDERFDSINSFPESYPIAFDNDRLASLVKFPYFVLFRGDGDVVSVYALFHSASNRDKWRQRVE